MSSDHSPSPDSSTQMLRVLVFWDLMIYGLAYISPIGPFSTWGFAQLLSGGAAPLSYLLGAVALYFTALSYAAMAKEVPGSGSAYAYARVALGETWGFMTGWTILLDYLLLPALMFVIFGITMAAVVPGSPRWVWIVLAAAYTIGVNWFGIKTSARFNAATLIAQFAILFVVIGFSVYAMHARGMPMFTTSAWWGPGTSVQSLFAATSLCLMAYLGFDAITTLTGEMRPDQTHMVGKAVLTTLTFIAALAIVQVWIFSDLSRGMTFDQLDTATFELLTARVDPTLAQVVGLAGGLALAFSITPTMVVAVSRVLHSMAEQGQMPRMLAHIHPTYGVPDRALLASGTLSIVIALLFSEHFDLLTTMVNFGAVLAFLAVNVSVIVYFRIRRRSTSALSHLILPTVGGLVLLAVLSQMNHVALMVGSAWMVLGAIVSMVLRGRGATPASAR